MLYFSNKIQTLTNKLKLKIYKFDYFLKVFKKYHFFLKEGSKTRPFYFEALEKNIYFKGYFYPENIHKHKFFNNFKRGIDKK